VPTRIATKVPASINALPPTSSSFFRCCGRIAYFTGPNSVECRPSRNSPSEKHGEAVQPEAGAADQHDGDFQQLDHAAPARDLSYLSASCPAVAENRKKGRMNTARREVGQQLRLERGPGRRLEGQQHHHRVLQHVVVERAEELGDEQRGEAARAQQAGLVAHGGSLSDSGRSGGF
jgi:hypothetical protein